MSCLPQGILGRTTLTRAGPNGINIMPRPPKSKAKRRVGLAVYLEPAVLHKLKNEAERDRRSTSTQAALYIEEGLGLRRNNIR